MKILSDLFIKSIRFYQRYISPHKIPCCRFTPTCSNYAIKAIEIHGPFIGSFLAIKRILRCNPMFKGGFDPVPEKKKNSKK